MTCLKLCGVRWINHAASGLVFTHLCFLPCQGPLLWGRILSSPSSPGSPPWSLSSSPLPPAPVCCQRSPPRGPPAPSPPPARPTAAASRRQSSPRHGWRSPAGAGPSSRSSSWWAWRRSSRSRSISLPPIGRSVSYYLVPKWTNQNKEGFLF